MRTSLTPAAPRLPWGVDQRAAGDLGAPICGYPRCVVMRPHPASHVCTDAEGVAPDVLRFRISVLTGAALVEGLVGALVGRYGQAAEDERDVVHDVQRVLAITDVSCLCLMF